MKKLLVGAFLGIFTLTGITVLPNYASAQTDWANPQADTNEIGDGSQTLTGSSLLDTIKNAINWILGILATIALVICLYGGFKMIISAGDENKYKSGLTILKNAAIGLVIIGLSWMIVSVVFWFVGTLGGGKQTQASTTNNTDAVDGSITAGQGGVGEVPGQGGNGGNSGTPQGRPQTQIQGGTQAQQAAQGRGGRFN